MAAIRLNADASDFVSAFELAENAIFQLDKQTVRVIKDLARLDEAGNIVGRRLTFIDDLGNKVATSFAKIKGQTEFLTASIRKADPAFRELAVSTRVAAEAQELFARAAVLGEGASAAETVTLRANATALRIIAQTTDIAATAQLELAGVQTNIGAQRAALTKFIRLEAQANTANTAALEAEAAVTQIATNGINALTNARRKELLVRAATTIAGGQLQTEAKDIRGGAQQAIGVERIANLRKIAAAELAQQAKITQKRILDEKRIRDERLKNARLIAEEEAALRLAAFRKSEAARVQTRRPGVDFRTIGEGGQATQQQIRNFLKAEAAIKKLVVTGKAGFAAMTSAIKAADAGTLKFAADLTIAERAALELKIAADQIGKGTKDSATKTKGLIKALKGLGSLVGISLLIGAAFQLVSAFTNAARAAGELSIKIAEIETITKNNSFSTERWADGLRELSNAFGIDTLKQAEGAYQILSNQIKNAAGATLQGAEALKFLETANRLAVTGVTDTANATNLLTAALNAFKLPAEEADAVVAKLFKTVELGRLRVEDLANIFGRVAVPAQQLGVSIDEVLGSITQLTIQGFKTDEAITGIRNVILKLIRPTEKMKQVFKELGVESGAALIQTRGFLPGLVAIAEKTGDSVEGIGEAFGRIRAIVGALGLVGDNAKASVAAIKAIGNASQEAFNEDTNRIIQSTGQQLKIAGEEAKNLFEKEIGQPALQAIAKFVKEAGGMRQIILDVTNGFKDLTRVIVATFIAFKAISLVTITFNLGAAAAATNVWTAAMAAFNTVMALNPLIAGGALLTAAIVSASTLLARSTRQALQNAEAGNLAILKSRQKLQRELEDANRTATKNFTREIDKRTKGIQRFFTFIAASQNKRVAELADQAKTIGRRFKIIIGDFSKSVSSQLTVATNEFKKFSKEVEKAAKLSRSILEKEQTVQLDIDIQAAGLGRRIQLLEDEIIKSREKVDKAVRTGDLKQFEAQRKLLNNLVKKRITAQVEFAREASRINSQIQEATFTRISATGDRQKKLAQERLVDLRRQNKVLQSGTTAQLAQERKIAEVREQARKAQDAASFTAALTQLKSLEREQERLNALAATERRIRLESARDAQIQAEQSEILRQTAEKRAELARKEAQRVKALQLLFNLLAKDAEKFQSKRVTEGETALEINKALVEQQTRFAQLITLSRELGGGRQTDLLFIQREQNLRERGQIQIDKLETQARIKRVEELKATLSARLKIAQDVQTRELLNIGIIRKNIADLPSPSASQPARRGRQVRAAIGDRFKAGAPGEFNVSKQAAFDFALTVKQGEQLNKLIQEQTAVFTEDRQQRIVALSKTILASLPDEEQLTKTLTDRTDLAPTRRREDDAVFNRGILNFILSVERAAAATDALGKQRGVIERIGAIIPKNLRLKEEESIEEVTSAQEKYTTALVEATEAAQNLRSIFFGERVLKGPTTVPDAAKPAGLSSIIGAAAQQPLAEDTRKAIEAGTTIALNRSRKKITTTFKAAIAKGTSGGIATGAKTPQTSTALQDLIASFAKGITKRATAAITPIAQPGQPRPSQAGRNPLDRRIQLGRGAESIAIQQDRIRKEVEKRTKEDADFRKKIREFEKQEQQRKLADAVASGRVGVNAKGELVTRGKPSPIQKATLTLSNKQLTAQETGNTILEQIRDGGSKRFEAGGPGALNLVSGSGILQRGQAEAEKELARELGLNSKQQNDLILETFNLATVIKAQQSIPEAASGGALREAVKAKAIAQLALEPGRRPELLGQRPKTGFAPFSPILSNLKPGDPTSDQSRISISVVVNETDSPQITAGEVVRQINRGLQQGTFKFRR